MTTTTNDNDGGDGAMGDDNDNDDDGGDDDDGDGATGDGSWICCRRVLKNSQTRPRPRSPRLPFDCSPPAEIATPPTSAQPSGPWGPGGASAPPSTSCPGIGNCDPRDEYLTPEMTSHSCMPERGAVPGGGCGAPPRRVLPMHAACEMMELSTHVPLQTCPVEWALGSVGDLTSSRPTHVRTKFFFSTVHKRRSGRVAECVVNGRRL